ncbi:probably inactive leucine-rich repeat receptor-like protein kinase IMK2 [Typha latifolia]|uniref:probably inactive leucine-rich repeat receptor-like protein kinase IMK2 n=1 Tax=Typha latifolia TaxID=4733 RepID=UPI003C2F9EDA
MGGFCQSSLVSTRYHKKREPFMKKLFPCQYLLLFLHILSLFCIKRGSCHSWDGVLITQVDYQGLQAMKHGLEDGGGLLRSWNDTGLDACSGAWIGIKCARGKVIAIQLPWKGLGGYISDKIGGLTALRRLSLHDNAIGGQIPASLGLLRDLRGVYLFNNRFSGAIPPNIGNCFLLQTLDLSNNLLTGSVPFSIANSTRLYRLNLSYNNLTGSIPEGLTGLPSLTFLLLQHNDLSGSIPDTWGGIGDNKSSYQLQTLNFDHNSLSGTIPISLGRLEMLQELDLSDNQLNGSIPEEIGSLSSLQILDLSGNSINGRFPTSLCNLSSLVQLNLEGNYIEDQIPEAIDGLKNLSFLSFSRNLLDGPIPTVIGNIHSLAHLDLSENNLTGAIPDTVENLTSLTYFNVSNNNLSGPVPLILAEKFDPSSFAGNLQLCGYVASAPCPSLHPGTRKLNKKELIVTVAGIVFLFLLLLCTALLSWLFGRRAKSSGKSSAGASTGKKTVEDKKEGGGGKLVILDGHLLFTADDLLCATAEIMGKSSYGTVYKATLEDGSQIAVKRLKEKLAKNPKEFEAELTVLGKIQHQNLLALRAYYMGPKGEKLLVFDFMPRGSLAAFLHARGPAANSIAWPTRMNIAMGIARGLHHLHTNAGIIHGNLTSSNTLLDEQTDPKISEYGLSGLMISDANSDVIATAGAHGYRAPELAKTKKADAKTDVYSLGMIILELVTGKPPGETINGMELRQWVASMSEEEWSNEVFDLELMKDSTVTQEKLVETLKLALRCINSSPVERPEVKQILQQLEEIEPGIAASVAAAEETKDAAPESTDAN